MTPPFFDVLLRMKLARYMHSHFGFFLHFLISFYHDSKQWWSLFSYLRPSPVATVFFVPALVLSDPLKSH